MAFFSNDRRKDQRERSLSLMERFCFGQPPITFFRRELDLTDIQKKAALRLFVVLMTISLISATLHPPTVIAQAIVFAMLFHQSMTNTRLSESNSLKFIGWLLTGVALSIATAVIVQGEPWFILPWSLMVLTGTMLHARKHRIPNFMGIIYVVTILYTPENPGNGIAQALWMLPVVGVMTIGLSLMAQWFMWPLSAMDLLLIKLKRSLDVSKGHLEILHASIAAEGNVAPAVSLAPQPGQTTELLSLLEQSAGSKECPRRHYGAWQELILDIETLGSILGELLRRHLKDPRAFPFDPEDQRAMMHLGIVIPLIRRSLERLSKKQSLPLVNDFDDLRQDHASPNQHSLKRALDATARIKRGLLILHETSSLLGSEDSNPRSLDPKTQRQQSILLIGPITMKDLRWAIKTSMATLIAVLLVQSLDVTTINTAIVTCVVVADTSLGADYRKSLLRIFGALLGGIFGIGFIVIVQPMIDTIGGYLIGISPVLFLAAWVASAGPRVAPIGIQIGFAFGLSVLDQMGPVEDIGILWFRVIGILVGIVIAGIVDALLWPERSLSMAKDRLVRVLDNLKVSMRRNLLDFDKTSSAYLLKVADSLLSEGRQLLDDALLEPGGQKPEQQTQIEQTRDIGRSMTTLMKIIESRHRYFLDPDFIQVGDHLKKTMAQLRLVYADEFEQLLRALDVQIIPQSSTLQAAWRRVETTIHEMDPATAMPLKDQDTLMAAMDLEEKMVLQLLETRRLITRWVDRYGL